LRDKPLSVEFIIGRVQEHFPFTFTRDEIYSIVEKLDKEFREEEAKAV
jgi:hypothetical protein